MALALAAAAAAAVLAAVVVLLLLGEMQMKTTLKMVSSPTKWRSTSSASW